METAAIEGVIGQGNKTRLKKSGDGEIAVMGKEGDVKTIWNSANTEETAHAKKTFDDFRAKGYLAFRVTERGDQGEQIREFDPAAGKMILVPPMAGG